MRVTPPRKTALDLADWRAVHTEIRKKCRRPEAAYVAIVGAWLRHLAGVLNLPAEAAAAEAPDVGDQHWCVAMATRLFPGVAEKSSPRQCAAAMTAALTGLAVAHEQWRAGSDPAEFPGVFYTPPPLVMRVCEELAVLAGAEGRSAAASKAAESGLRVLDPAVGCGAFLLGWLAVAGVGRGRRMVNVAWGLHGWDIDAVAVAIARWRILAACAGAIEAGVERAARRRVLTGLQKRLQAQVRCVDALRQPVTADYDVVVGNPPFLFLSGKGSPVARAAGRRAQELKSYYAEQTARYGASSKGCRDYCKWFLQLAVEQTRPGGWLALVTTSTWMYLRQYRDVRQLLKTRTRLRTLCDLGYGEFERPTLGAAFFTARRRETEGVAPAAAEGFDNAAGSLRFLRRENGIEKRMLAEWQDDGIEVFRSAWARYMYRRRDLTTLGQLLKLAEGEHDIRRGGLESAAQASKTHSIPIFEDHRLQVMQPPAVRWWPAAAGPRLVATLRERHSGARALLRKTGAGLLAAPAGTEDFVLAHQNVYVLRSLHAGIPPEWLALWLTAEPVQRLYREGPHGQPGRPLAQLRIANLQRLPAPPAERWLAEGALFRGLLETLPADLTAATREVRAWRRQLAMAVEFLFRPAGVGARSPAPERVASAQSAIGRRLRKDRSGIK